MISKIGNFANTGKDMLSPPNAEFYHINLTSISTFLHLINLSKRNQTPVNPVNVNFMIKAETDCSHLTGNRAWDGTTN